MPKVTIYTQAYNPGEFLKPCIESVLGQTYGDFEWFLLNHGSTDNTQEIIERYAEKDKRIVPLHIEVNGSVPDHAFLTIREKGTGKYLAWLDSDDWWDPDYLEHLVPFAEENRLDLAMTGAVQYFQQEGVSRAFRRWDEPLLMTVEGFARNFPVIGPFAGAFWANLRRMDKVLESHYSPSNIEMWEKGIAWRSDTLMILNYVDYCQRIGIDQYAPYHYRQYSGSLSRQYDDTYFVSNLYFCQRLEEFFRKHGVWNEQLEEYVKQRFFFEMNWSLEVLRSTSIPADEKLRVCAGMASHPRTLEAIPHRCKEQENWRKHLRGIVSDALHSGELPEAGILQELLRPLAPDCCGVLTVKGSALFTRERDLLPLLFENNRQALTKRFLDLIEKEEEPEQYDLGTMLQSVLPENSPLRAVEDVRFFKYYPELTQLVLGSGCLAALDQMTALLLKETPLKSKESFLQLYLTLAALENQVSAFVFGKIHLAKLYHAQGCVPEFQAALQDLEEMGAGELPEVLALKEAREEGGLL